MRWTLSTHTAQWTPGEYDITTTTDIANHLYLYWTREPPLKKGQLFPRRGGWCQVGDFFWPMPLNIVDQTLPGNTLQHIHNWPGWDILETRYYMFFPSLDLTDPHSFSPVFTLTSPGVWPSMKHTDLTDKEIAGVIDHADLSVTPAKLSFTPGPPDHTSLTDKEIAGVIDHADLSVTPAKLASPFTFANFPFTPASPPTQDYHTANKKYADDMALASLWPALQADDLHIFSDFTGFLQNVTFSGLTYRAPTNAECSTGITNNSIACINTPLLLWVNSGLPAPTMDWNQPVRAIFVGAPYLAGVASTRWCWWGINSQIVGGALANQGARFRWNRNGAILYTETRNAAGLESQIALNGVDIWTRMSRWEIVHTPGVSVKFYRNGALLTTHALRVPSGTVAGSAHISIGAENLASGLDTRVFMNRIIVRKGWSP